MKWIYLSPHFDDIAFSCGGLLWEQTQKGDIVEVWTICAAPPPTNRLSTFASSKHASWKTGKDRVDQRKLEDQTACHLMGAKPRYFSVQDCIYRQNQETGEFFYPSEKALWGPIHPSDQPIIDKIASGINHSLSEDVTIVSPLAIGNHVDHKITRMAAEKLTRNLWYYADFPYVLNDPESINLLLNTGWTSTIFPISQQGLNIWTRSVLSYTSQISTFWDNESEVQRSLQHYLELWGGIALWRSPKIFKNKTV